MAKKDPYTAALENWINVNGDTREFYKRYGGDFWLMLPVIQKRIKDDGVKKYLAMDDEEIDQICREIDEKNKAQSREPDENGVIHISNWHGYNERDVITMIKAFSMLSSEDQGLVLAAKGFW